MMTHPSATGNLSDRTREFASNVMSLVDQLESTRSNNLIARQVIRSATCTGASYREGRRARSRSEFISKLSLSLQELEETRYWLELIESRGLADVSSLLKEADEITAMLNSSVTTARKNMNHR